MSPSPPASSSCCSSVPVASFVRITRGVLLAVVFLTALTWSGAARADSFVDQQGWAKTGAVGPVAPQDGHLYVSVAAGQEQARAYLHLADADTTGTISFAEASDGISPDSAALAACAL